MRVGHVIALVGALLALFGGTVLEWQHFALADVTARAFEAPLAGQAVLVLAALTLAFSVGGLVTRRRRSLAAGTLTAAVFTFGWLVYAQMGKLGAFTLVPFEAVEMLPGYTLAVWGALFALVGALVVFASEPAWTPRSRFLRVALLWGDTVVQETVLQEARTFTIGDALRNDLVLPEGALPARFPLFRANRKGEYSIGLSRDLGGEITVNQRTQTVGAFLAGATDAADGVDYVPITDGDWGTLELGAMRVFFQFVTPDARRRRSGLVTFDETVSSSIAISFFAQVSFVILGVLMWNEPSTRAAYIEQKRQPDIEAAVMTLAEPEVPLVEESPAEDDRSAKAAGGEAGKFGDPDEDPAKRSHVPMHDAKRTDHVDAKHIGLNDLLATNKLGGSGAISQIMNATSEGLSNKLAVAMAGSDGDFVVGYGSNGMAFEGDGPGGGDDGVGRIHAIGQIDTGGPGIHANLGIKPPKRVGRLTIDGGTARGFCSQSQIASVVKRQAGAIRACYEQRLQVAKDLKGKLTVRWNVQLDGGVDGVAAIADTLADDATTNCIFRNLRRMRFQKPDGGICVVQWPFVFSPG